MEATFDSNGLKVFSRIIKYMARLGNEVYFEASDEALLLKAINNSSTGLLRVTFNQYFFTQYQIAAGTDPAYNNFCIAARPLLMALKNVNHVANCRMNLEVAKENFIVRMYKPKDIELQYAMTLLSTRESLHDTIVLNTLSTIVCPPLLLGNLLKNIPKTVRELAFDISENGLGIRNHISHPDKDVQTVRLNYKLNKSEFSAFELETVFETTTLIFSAPDFIAFVELAEKTSAELKIEFSQNGLPMSVSIDNDPVTKIQIIMSTMQEEALEKVRKPSSITTYKEMVGSFIENRLASHNATNSAKQRAYSPKIGSFGDKDLRLQKRKSTDMEPDKEKGSKDPSKKPRSKHVLSQKEQMEIEDFVAHCDDFPSEVGDLLRNKPSEDVQPNFMAGMDGLRFTVHQSDSTSVSLSPSPYKEIEVQAVVEPQRMDTMEDDNSDSSLENARQQMLKIKTVFGRQLRPEHERALQLGNTLCENSDSEDIE